MLGENGGSDMNADRGEMLRKKACQKWQADGRPDGEHNKHWRDAESEFSTTGEEELGNRGGHDLDRSPTSSDLPKVGEFVSPNK
jgi:hypothetical protein